MTRRGFPRPARCGSRRRRSRIPASADPRSMAQVRGPPAAPCCPPRAGTSPSPSVSHSMEPTPTACTHR
uniref:Uncharacterized protein n=1 Tax=Arundo donax TaxID=35708 RepID=A0A0A9CDQ4_ARUDO